jgi:hypothetical protein
VCLEASVQQSGILSSGKRVRTVDEPVGGAGDATDSSAPDHIDYIAADFDAQNDVNYDELDAVPMPMMLPSNMHCSFSPYLPQRRCIMCRVLRMGSYYEMVMVSVLVARKTKAYCRKCETM